MTDLSRVLPSFPTAQYAHLLAGLEKAQVTTADLLVSDVLDLGKRSQLPLLDLRRLCDAVLEALHVDLGVSEKQPPGATTGPLQHTVQELKDRWRTISTLDEKLDRVLGGGIPTGYITELTGESGAGKTQFLLTLLLAVQLPPPHGLGRPALYISTEAALSTRRLSQILTSNSFFRDLDASSKKPTLDRVFSAVTPDLESQDHILDFQVPVQVSRFNVGLIVLDSVAANYRAEFERGSRSSSGSNMAARSAELIRLGQLLQDLARKHNLAVVVANQVADRFAGADVVIKSNIPPPSSTSYPVVSQESPLASRSRGAPPKESPSLPGAAEPPSSTADEAPVRSSMPEPRPEEPPAPPALLLDHQQRWFTGWGDDPYADYALKTPSLGLVWSTQIACRIALFKQPVYGRRDVVEDEETASAALRSWRRWMKIVFAPHVPASGQGLEGAVEFEITGAGVKSVEKEKKKKKKQKVLDPGASAR